MNRRKRLAKISTCVVLSLFLLSFSLPVSAELLLTDASLVFPEVPVSEKGFIRYIPTSSSNQFDSSGFTYSMQAATASYSWRNNWYFDSSLQPTISPSGAHSIIMWKYGSALTFDLSYIYEFRINLRFQSIDVIANSTADMTKLLLCFGDTDAYFNASTITPANVTNHFRGFAPSSWTWNSGYTTCEVVYRVPVFPGTLFPDLEIEDSGTGVKFVSVACMAIQDIGSGMINFVQQSSGGIWRYSGSFFPRTTSAVKLYTAEEWQSHVTEQGFDDLSKQINLQTGEITSAIENQTEEITDSIDNAVDQILNPPVPTPSVDSLIDAHQAEEDFSSSIKSTLSFSSVQSSLDMSQMLLGINSGALWLRSWLNVAFQNPLINLVVNACLGFALIYMFYRSWL